MTREAGRSAHAATWSGIVGNMALAVIKTGVGYMANSKSLLADGLYSASEAASSLVGLFPSKSVKSKDKVQRERLREHARAARPGMTVLLAVLILMGGLQLAISALGTLSSDEIEAPGRSVLLIAVAALAVKEAIFQFQYRVFRKRNQSQAMSYALQHRRALYCSLIVLIGIIGSMAGKRPD